MSKDLITFNNKQYQVAFKSAQISFPEYQDMKKAVDTLHDDYMKWEATPDNLKSSKAARAKLNKLRKAINDRKNEIVKQADKPVNDFKAQIKDLTVEIKETSDHINQQIKVYENKAKQDRHNQNVKRIEKMAKEAGVEAQPILDEYDPRWDNKTASYKAFKEEVERKIESLQTLQKQIEAGTKVIAAKAEELKIGPTNYIEKLKNGQMLDLILKQMQNERDYLDDMAKKQEERKKQEQKELKTHGGKAVDSKTGEIKDKLYTFSLVFDKFDTNSLKALASFLSDWGIKTNKTAVNLTSTKEQAEQLARFIKSKDLSAKRVK